MKILSTLLIVNIYLFSSTNTFFTIENKIALTCEDAEKITLKDNSIKFTYNKKGRKKLNDITEHINSRLGLIVEDTVIFFDIRIRENMAEDNKHNTITFSTKNKDSAKLFFKSFGKCKNGKFVNE
ncbi:MAG: hypothetical protein HRT41_12570 [Campylobacteraceae bacterium]|nr:hypothetical protein [Campylobacteraceae bacterium]